jgi:hypothetical protein
MPSGRHFFFSVFVLAVAAMLALAAYGYYSGAWDANPIPPPAIVD